VDFDEAEPDQRHMSHFYPVYPGAEITPRNRSRRSLHRLESRFGDLPVGAPRIVEASGAHFIAGGQPSTRHIKVEGGERYKRGLISD
jgi:hypothetical protein